MPTPVSNHVAPPPTLPPETAPIGPPPPPPPVVTIDPVIIVGDAGRQELLKRHAAATAAPACLPETRAAQKGVVGMVAGALTTLGGAVTGGPIGFAGGLAYLFDASLSEGEALRDLYECKKQ